MKTNFTQGEWKINNYEEPHGQVYRVETNETYICELHEAYYETLLQEDEANANAKLIAAAPNLLESCNRLLSQLNGLVGENDDINYALAAIKKATE